VYFRALVNLKKMEMKNIIITTLFCLFTSTLWAQIKEVEEVKGSMSQGQQNGLKVLVPETKEKDAQKAWTKLMKDYESKTEKVKKTDEYLSVDAKIPALGERPVNVYSIFQETPEGTYVTLFFDLGGAFLNSEMHKEQTDAANEIIKNYATQTARATIEEMVKEETKQLEKLEKEYKGLQKDKEGYDKDIKEAKETIEKRENQLVENAKEQEKQKIKIAEQTEIAEKIKAKLKKYL
jgi:hypothetical protein